MTTEIKNKGKITRAVILEIKLQGSNIDKPPGRCIVRPPELSLRGHYYPQQSQRVDDSTRGIPLSV